MNNQFNNTKSTIKSILKETGFDEIGFASAKVKDESEKHFREWLGNGYHGSMSWMEKNIEKREDITNIMPTAKSVIVCLLNYFTAHEHSNEECKGKISRYAWGDDYHIVADRMLKSAMSKLRTLYALNEFKHYTDTGPVPEKTWAVRAGLGWQGKNSLLLNSNLGSYCFISVIITDLDLEPDTKQSDHCGTCSACIAACPTDAIIQPKVVDSRKCISYWTIEAKPDLTFPSDITQKLNGWLFGCDICQDVCPWNRKIKPTININFKPRDNQTELDLKSVGEMDEESFRIRIRNSPLKRTKLKGLQRNAVSLQCKE